VVFSLAPLLVMIFGTAFPVLLVGIFAKLTEILSLTGKGTVEPAWLQHIIRLLLETGNVLALPLAVLLMSAIIWRQRLSPFWLLLSLAVLWPTLICASIEFPATIEIARKSGAALSVGAGFSTSGGFNSAQSTLWLTARALALLPIAWLLWSRRRLAKVPLSS
jgi:hypothetical protein